MVQAVPLELQWSLAPVLLTAATWKYWASGLGDQDMAMAPSAHCSSTATSWGAQGADGEKERGEAERSKEAR